MSSTSYGDVLIAQARAFAATMHVKAVALKVYGAEVLLGVSMQSSIMSAGLDARMRVLGFDDHALYELLRDAPMRVYSGPLPYNPTGPLLPSNFELATLYWNGLSHVGGATHTGKAAFIRWGDTPEDVSPDSVCVQIRVTDASSGAGVVMRSCLITTGATLNIGRLVFTGGAA